MFESGVLPSSVNTHNMALRMPARSLYRAVRRLGSAASPLPRLKVVLDMDECLIHSTAFSDRDGDHRQTETSRPNDLSGAEQVVETFTLVMADGVSCTVLKRPHLDVFLEACAEEFDTFVFTAGTEDYASPLLDYLDPDKQLIIGRRYRSDCRLVRIPAQGLHFLKDLRAVVPDEEDHSRLVLIDNNPLSFVCQPRNGIPVPDFVGDPDDALPAVLELLRQLKGLKDVRPTLHEMFGLEGRLASLRERLLGDGDPAPRSKL